jgi:hypothetical protein
MVKRWMLAAGLVLGVALGAVGVAGPAWADDSSEFPSCRYLWTGGGAPYGGGDYTGSGDWYAYTPQFVTQSWSACEDIQIVALRTQSPSQKFRVRFYPSSGGSYANGWKYVNNGCWSCNFVLATNVSNGTRYRIETVEDVGGTQTILYRAFDVND